MPADPDRLDRAAEQLGRKVYELRQLRSLTQEQLSDLSGVSRNQIQNIEHSRNNSRDPLTNRHGRGNPRLDTLYHLAEAFGISPVLLIDPDAEVPRA